MLKIGITGGIGVGKSIVMRLFAVLGVPVYDADTRAKWVMHHHDGLREELLDTYGPKAYTSEGELNRAFLAKVVFNDSERLAQLNSLVHPRVREDFEEWMTKHSNSAYVVKEAALMYESEAWKQMDEIIAVYAPLEVRLKRLQQRDTHRTEADIKAIIAKQLSEEEKIKRAQHLIHNDDTHLVIPQVLALHEDFLGRGTKQ